MVTVGAGHAGLGQGVYRGDYHAEGHPYEAYDEVRRPAAALPPDENDSIM